MEGLKPRREKLARDGSTEPQDGEETPAADGDAGEYDALLERLFSSNGHADNGASQEIQNNAGRPIIQGFVSRRPAADREAGNAMRYNALYYSSPPEVIREVVEVDKGKKPCQQCGELFKPRTTWHKYCRPECREAYHAAKHGEVFNPKEFHKARRRKTGKGKNG